MPTLPDFLVERALKYRPKCFVETHTGGGESVDAMAGKFEHVFTIDSSEERYVKARDANAFRGHVHCYHGMPRTTLYRALSDMGPGLALIWLCFGAEQVRDEIFGVASHCRRDHIIMVDEADDMLGGSVPTIQEVARSLYYINSGYTIELFPRTGRGMLVALLVAERDRLNRAIEALQGPAKRRGRPPKDPLASPAPASAQKRRRKFTAAQRKAQAARMKALWAKRKNEAK
jgi:hypothetical protein